MFMIDQANIAFALLLSSLAGLSTGIGSLIAFFIHKPKKQYLCFSLGGKFNALIIAWAVIVQDFCAVFVL